MTDSGLVPELVIEYANRFEAIAADGFEGKPYEADLADLARRVKAQPGLAARVAHALGIMIGFIEDSDKARRFAPKVAILREAIHLLQSAA